MKICPKCGEPVAILSVSGPWTGRVAPCGHEVNPAAIEERETLVVVDSDRQTIDVPDAPLPTRLAAIQRQLDERDVVTTADVQALGDEIQPVVSGLAEALQPVLDAFAQVAKDLADAFSAIDLDVDDQDSDDDRDSRLPESIRNARERRRRQREQVENELGDYRYP